MGIYRYLNTSKHYLGLPVCLPSPSPSGQWTRSHCRGKEAAGP